MERVFVPDSERKPLPTSGQILGWLADFLRVKGALKDTVGADERTARRLFAGERVEPEKREAILRQLVGALEPRVLVDESFSFGLPEDWLFEYAVVLTRQWDRLASDLRGGSFPITNTTDAPLPFLRMVVLDGGLRIAALQVLREQSGRATSGDLELLVHNALKVAMDACIARCDRKPTLENIRKECRVSKNSLDAWRAGTQIPQDENLRQLAACLASRGAGDEARVLSELRFGAAISAGWHTLANFLSDRKWLDDHVDALKRVVQHAREYFRLLPLPVDVGAALREVVVLGAHSRAGAAASMHLANLAPLNQEVQADFIALPRDWAPRINEHVKALEIPARALPQAPAMQGRSQRELAAAAKAIIHLHFRMAGWDATPKDLPYMFTVSGSPEMKAINRLIQADRMWSAGEREEALMHLRRAIDLNPGDASLHYKLGSYLGILLLEERRLDLLDEALLELRMAVELVPDDLSMKKAALPELGVVLSNAGRLDEALNAFEEAEPFASDSTHYWLVRGSTLMWVRRLEEAEQCLRKALALQGDNPHVLVRLAAVVSALGRVREARDLARQVERQTEQNPEPYFDQILNSAPRWD